DLDGKFIMTGLAPGLYDVTCLFLGYATMKINDVGIKINRTSTQDFYLVTEEVLKKEIEVRAKAQPIIEKEKTGTTEVIGGEYIEALPIEGRAFQQVLRVLPGVFMDSSQQIHIRGGQSGTVGWALDGMTGQDPMSGGYFNINMSAVEEVEVITGGADARYGNNMSGQVNVVTKSGTDTFHGTLEYNYQNNDWYGSDVNNKLYNPIFTLGGPIIKDKLTFFASFEIEDNKGAFPAALYDQDDYQDATWQESSFFGKATYQMTPDDKWVYSYMRNDIETRWASEMTIDWRLPTQSQFTTEHSLDYTHLFSGGTNLNFTVAYWQRGFSVIMKDKEGNDKDWTEYEPCVFFDNELTNRYERNDHLFYPLVGNILGDHYLYEWFDITDAYYSAEFTSRDILDNHTFIFGGTFQDVGIHGELIRLPIYYLGLYDYLHRRDELGQEVDPTKNWQQMAHLFYDAPDVRTNWISGYAVDNWSLVEDIKMPLIIQPSFRFDYDEFTSKAVVSPRMGVNYIPNDKTLIRVHYGWFFQFVNLWYYQYPDQYWRSELSDRGFYSPSSSSQVGYIGGGKLNTYFTSGVEELKNPVNIAYELGVERQLSENSRLQVNLFYKDMKDLIENFDRNPDPGITEEQVINLSKAWAAGLEVNFTKRLADNWETRLSYTYIESKSTGVDENGQLVDEMFWVDWDYRHSGSFALLWKAPWEITINTIFEYRTGLPYNPQRLEKKIKSDGTFSNYRIDESINTARYPDYQKLDITIQKMFIILKDYKLTLSLQVYNVFDKLNPVYESNYNSDIDRLTGEILRWEEGRKMQFGVKFEF
ncbi:TonB-dependent receptor, partial [bacterium]|nr:TonB-dependent receptor [bacterium]